MQQLRLRTSADTEKRGKRTVHSHTRTRELEVSAQEEQHEAEIEASGPEKADLL